MAAMTIRRTFLAACAVVTLGCSGDPETVTTGTHASAIVRGVDSPADRDAVVLLMHYDAIQVGGASAGCTGTLLTPRLVLTARHCIAETDPTAACSREGKPLAGGKVSGNRPASTIFAFVGNKRPDFISGLENAARGAEIIDTGAKTYCNEDIALVLLDRPLPNAKIAPVRLEGGPRKGEVVTVVGFGISDKSASPPIRQERTGVNVLQVGPAENLGPAEFRVGEGTCAGDSGGPAIAESGAVIGVLSRGGNGKDPKDGEALACLGSGNLFTATANYAELIRGAADKAGQPLWLEGEPPPTPVALKAPDPEPEAPPEPASGCTIHPLRRAIAPSFASLLVALAAMCVVRRQLRRRE